MSVLPWVPFTSTTYVVRRLLGSIIWLEKLSILKLLSFEFLRLSSSLARDATPSSYKLEPLGASIAVNALAFLSLNACQMAVSCWIGVAACAATGATVTAARATSVIIRMVIPLVGEAAFYASS